MSLLGLFSIFSTTKQAIKESLEPTIPAENWANKELYHQDLMNGMSAEERMRNVKNGRYKLTETYPEPHRDPTSGKIIIENDRLYHRDVRDYGAVQAQKWVKQGKYNLSPEELKKYRDRIEKMGFHYIYDTRSDEEIEAELIKQKETERIKKESQQKKETELLKQQKIKQELQNARQVALSECRDMLTKANYNNIEFSLKHCTGIINEPYGYNIGCISMQKGEEKYNVGFEVLSLSNLSEADGNALLKSLAKILTTVNISDLDNRNLLLKEALKTEEIILRNENEEFNIVNDVLTIVVIVCSLEVSLQFYTSEIASKAQLPNFDNMDGHEFEFFCASLLRKNGYENVSVTSGSGDQGVDIIAYKDDIKYGIQCKCYHSDIGNKAVQEVYAGKNFYNCDVGVVMTNRYFTKSAIELAKKNRIHLWDRKKLMQVIENCNAK